MPDVEPIDDERLRSLDSALLKARMTGILGPVSTESLVAHSRGYLLESWRTLDGGSFADCGSGSGALGVILALQLPKSDWTLIESRHRRCELIEGVVRHCGLSDRMKVAHARVEELARSDEMRGTLDGVVARKFGPAAELAECALPLLKIGGTLVVSVSARTDAEWRSADLRALTGCELSETWSTRSGSYLAAHRWTPAPGRLPRSVSARRRSPLL